MTDATKIGWIGLGKMGIPMSRRLIKAGFPVTVYNRTQSKETTLQSMGVTTASSPGLLIQHTDVVIIMVTDDQAIRDIFTGPQGLLPASTRDRTIINMSTVSPAISREMSALCNTQGHHYLDAPVSGSVRQAEEGQLVIMAGGEDKVFQQAQPIFQHLGRLSLRVGDTGAGNTAKLAINSLLGLYAQGLAETVVFARQHGIRTEDLLTLINNSALNNVFTKMKGDAIVNNNFQAAFALKHIAKDLRLAKDLGLTTPLGKVACETFQEAAPILGEEDIIAIIKHLN